MTCAPCAAGRQALRRMANAAVRGELEAAKVEYSRLSAALMEKAEAVRVRRRIKPASGVCKQR